MAKKYQTIKQKGLKRGIEVNPRVRLGKEEYQAWRTLHDRKLQITQRKFRDYTTEVKKANAKLNRIQNDPNYFINEKIKLTENLLVATTQEELDRILKRPSEILDEGYEERLTQDNIDRLQENVDRIFGEGTIDFRQLDPKLLNAFFENNEHLVYLIYYPEDTKADNIVEMTGGVEAINKNITYWKNKGMRRTNMGKRNGASVKASLKKK